MCPWLVARGHVEEPHGVPLHVRREVRVAHRHVDRGVAEELLDGLQRHGAHDEVGREGVPEVVRREPLREAGLRARPRHDVLYAAVREPRRGSQNTYGPFRCRCVLSVAIASSESGTSRVRPPFGVPSWSRQSVRRTTSRPTTRSRSSQRSASSSPTRRPVLSAVVTNAFHSGAAARRKRSVSSNVRNWKSLYATRSCFTRGACESSPHSTARLRSLRRTHRWLFTDFAACPSLNFRPLYASTSAGPISSSRRLPNAGTRCSRSTQRFA